MLFTCLAALEPSPNDGIWGGRVTAAICARDFTSAAARMAIIELSYSSAFITSPTATSHSFARPRLLTALHLRARRLTDQLVMFCV